METLHNMQYKGISGVVSFAVDGSQSSPPYTLYQVSQRKWQVVRTFGG
jgi:branched-chain amino acid transport system substrate-binding protein